MNPTKGATPSLDYYLETAQRAGLPIGTDKAGIKQMNIANPLSRFAIEPVVRGDAQGQISGLEDERAQKIQRLAQADKALYEVYGQNGKLASNNPFLLENALNTATSIEGANIGATDAAIQGLEEGIQSRVKDVAAFYQDLITTNTKENAGKGGSGVIDWDAELSGALDIGLDEYTPEELDTILSEYGLEL